jgi:DNA-binding transcriptional LysR family regulator
MARMLPRSNVQVQRSFLHGKRKLSCMIDVRRLLLLRELHARGTVAAVAEALAYSPSAVSQGLATLQREAGVPLTERVGRRLQLTEAGLRLVDHAEALLARLEEAEAELQAAAEVVGGRVRVGALQTPLLSLVPPALSALADQHPGLRVELLEMEPEVSLPAVALGELEVAIAEEYDHAPRAIPGDLQRERLLRDQIVVVLPAGHPLAASSGPVPLAALAGETWATGHADTEFAAMFVGACRSLGGFEPDIRHRCNDVAIMLALISAGLCVGLLPRLGHPPYPGVAGRPIAERDIGRTIFAFHRRSTGLRPAVRAVVGALREAAEDVGRAA